MDNSETQVPLGTRHRTKTNKKSSTNNINHLKKKQKKPKAEPKHKAKNLRIHTTQNNMLFREMYNSHKCNIKLMLH
jgi:hypothetical protein